LIFRGHAVYRDWAAADQLRLGKPRGQAVAVVEVEKTFAAWSAASSPDTGQTPIPTQRPMLSHQEQARAG